MICLTCGAEMPEHAYFCGKCGAKIRNKVSETFHHFTPHGGVETEVFFFDKNHEPCVKEKAWFMEFCEYDAAGNEIYKFTAHRKPKKAES